MKTLSCQQSTAIALLAYMLPCLEAICLTDGDENVDLYHLAQKIGRANRLDPGGSHHLSKLVHIREAGSHEFGFSTMRSFESFCSLPSMCRYEGRYLSSENISMMTERKSQITCIELDGSI